MLQPARLQVLYLQCHHINAVHPKFTVVVDAQPGEADFDPCNIADRAGVAAA